MSDLKPYPDRSGDGVPYCTYEKCPQYDGKRCDLMGQRPSRICEPAVQDLVKENRDLAAQVAKLTRELETARVNWEVWQRAARFQGSLTGILEKVYSRAERDLAAQVAKLKKEIEDLKRVP